MKRVRASDYHDIAKASDPRVSPDGERVAFVRQVPKDDESYERTIYVAPVGGAEPKRFSVAEGSDGEPRWSPDGETLAFVSDRGEETDRPQLHLLPTDGGEAEVATDVAGGVSQLAWSPDGRYLAFVQSVTDDEREKGYDLELGDEEYEREAPDPRVIDRHVYRAGAKYFDEARSQIYLLDVDAGEVTRVTDDAADHATPAWGDAETLYYSVKRGRDADDSLDVDIDAYDVDSADSETVTTTTGWGTTLAAAGRHVAYLRTPLEGFSMRSADVEVLDVESGESWLLTEDFDRTIEPIRLAFDPDGNYVYFATPDEGEVVLRRVRVGGGDVERVFDGGHVDGFDVGRDAVAVTQSEWDHPSDLFAATPAGAEAVRLTRLNADYLDGRAVREPEEVWFENGEGDEIQGWVLTPPDFDPDETYPLAVEIHGGPHAMWSTAGTMWHEWQALAAAGYVVFWSNPRGSTGYGEEHAMAIERDWGDVTMMDVMAGAQAVAERDYVDASNAFVTGGSFGGYMTGWIVGHTDFFAGAVAQRGVYDFASFYGSTDAFKLVEGDYGTTPWEEPAFLWEQSPVAYADQVETPTLVMHADNDFRVPVNNGEMFYLFLRKNDVDTRLVRYPREGHELSRSGEPGHVVDRIERTVRWFDGYSEYTDVPPALERDLDAGLSSSAAADEDE